MTNRLGRADLHLHTLASDGTAGVIEILDHVGRNTELDVIAITDHERIDAAIAARTMALDHGVGFEVIVGEEVTTRGGHLLALFIDQPIKPLRSLRETIARVHDQGGIAIPAHPLVPYPLCAQGGSLRRLAADPDERYRPDALETFNPTALGKPRHRQAIELARELGLAMVGNSDAHSLAAIGQGWTTFPGRGADDLRRAILERQTHWHGSFHGKLEQLPVFARQLRKYSQGWSATLKGQVRRDGTGRDLGYPGGTHRPAVFDREAARGRLAPAAVGGPAGSQAAGPAVSERPAGDGA